MRWLGSSDVEGGPGRPIRALLRTAERERRAESYDRRRLPVLHLFTQDNAIVRLRPVVGSLLVVMVQKGETNFGNTILIFLFSDK